MSVEEVIKWTDNLVFSKTGKHLVSLQKAVVEGTWQGKKYPEIARDCNRTHDRIKQVARELWQLISEELGEDVKQSNFRAILERVEDSNVLYFGSGDGVNIGDINFCRENCPHSKDQTNRSHSTNQTEKHYDLTNAPEYDRLSNRTTELKTLKQWILEENSRIVTIFGLSGMGKTTLTRQLVEEIKDNFDRIIWRSHHQFSTLNDLKTNLIDFFSQEAETPYLSILDCLRSHSCLIILDDLHEILTRGELVGTYCSEYANYGRFLKEIARSPHNSCLLLLGWEKPREIATLESKKQYCHSLQLQGLGESAQELLAIKQLQDEDRYSELIDRYNGNPLWLNIIAATIEDLFNSSIAQFLSYPTLFLGDLESILHEHYQRLSESEQWVMLWLANQNEAISLSHKPTEIASESDFLKAIQSLRKRGLLDKVTNDKISLFTLQPVIKQYVRNQQVNY